MEKSNADYYQIPEEVFKRDGPFKEFKQDASVVTVELSDKSEHSKVLVLYPNYIIGMKGRTTIPFDPTDIVRVYQTPSDEATRTDKSWTIWPHPWQR